MAMSKTPVVRVVILPNSLGVRWDLLKLMIRCSSVVIVAAAAVAIVGVG